MVDQPLPYGRQWIDDDDVAGVVAVLESERLTQGPLVERFEAALCAATGARHAVAVSSGTAALHLACLAAGVEEGDVGITSPITFMASANCVAFCGGTPAFADVDPATATLDPNALEDACRKRRPAVVLPVDFAGQPADLPAIEDVARRHGAVVVEDAAHALGARYTSAGQEHRVGACSHADMAVLSFHPVKHITTGEGGAVLTNDAALATRLRELRSHGITRDRARLRRDDGPWYHELHALGFNYRITDIQSALGLSQLRRLDTFVERRRALAALYAPHLERLGDDVRPLGEVPGRRSSYHLLVVQIRGDAGRRRRVFEALHTRGILVQVHYIPVHTQPYYAERHGCRPGDFPKAEAYYQTCLSLPLFPRMADADVERVAAALGEALAETRP